VSVARPDPCRFCTSRPDRRPFAHAFQITAIQTKITRATLPRDEPTPRTVFVAFLTWDDRGHGFPDAVYVKDRRVPRLSNGGLRLTRAQRLSILSAVAACHAEAP
jgi:hypothetical protein